MNSYHNTTQETGQTLLTFKGKAKRQDEDVLDYFLANPENSKITPEKVLDFLKILNPSKYDHETMIISIRRAFSNLKALGKIETTGEMLPGNRGRNVHAWKLS